MRIARIFLHPVFILSLALAALLGMAVQPLQAFYNLRPGANASPTFPYTLDDAYIHMTIAKNLVDHGIYGVTPDGFTSSSSSILWTLLLALGYAVTRVLHPMPFVMNIFSGGLAVFFVWRILRRAIDGQPVLLLASLLGVIVFTPLPTLMLSGMETVLQVALMLAFLDAAQPIFTAPRAEVSRGQAAYLLASGCLLAAVRYESLALITMACLVLLCQRRVKLALLLGVLALLPAAVYGLVSLGAGWYFLPNSVLVKSSNTAQGWREPARVMLLRFQQMLDQPAQRHLKALFGAGLAAMFTEMIWPTSRRETHFMLVLYPLTLLSQVLLGQLGWFYRYEAYTVAFGVLALCCWFGGGLVAAYWHGMFTRRRGMVVKLVLMLVIVYFAWQPLYDRGMKAYADTPGALTNIYDQQVQMARFTRQYYAGTCVVINDIGAVSLFGSDCIIDLAGLATLETADAAIERRPLEPVIRELGERRQAKLAMVYLDWFPRQIPPEWVPVGSWSLDRQVVAGGRTVTFLAVDPAEAGKLREHLIEFSTQLPHEVEWKIK